MIGKVVLAQIAEDPQTFLSQGRFVKALVRAKQEKIDDWRQLAESTTAMVKDEGGAGPSGYKQSLIENAVCGIVDLETALLADIDELIVTEHSATHFTNSTCASGKLLKLKTKSRLNACSSFLFSPLE